MIDTYIKPVVSVIIPTYNYGAFILNAIESIVQQTFGQWECIIIDDGSTDQTKSVVTKYTSKDPRIKYFYQENQGLSAARNAGIKLASGRFIQLLDADDMVEKEKFERQNAVFEKNVNIDIVYGNARFFTTKNLEMRELNKYGYKKEWVDAISGYGNDILVYLLKRNIFPVNCPIIKRESLEKIGLFNTSYRAVEDWDFWIRCALGNLNFYYCESPNTNALIRFQGDSMSTNNDLMVDGLLKLYSTIEPLPLSKKQRIIFRNSIFNLLLGFIANDLKKNKKAKALEKIDNAFHVKNSRLLMFFKRRIINIPKSYLIIKLFNDDIKRYIKYNFL